MKWRKDAKLLPIHNYWREFHQNSDPRDYAQCSNFRRSVEHFEQALSYPFFFIDHLRADLVYASSQVESYLPALGQDVYGDEYGLSSQRILPEHYAFVTQLSHKIIFDRLYALPKEQRTQAVFCKDYKVQNESGEIMWLLQKGKALDIDSNGFILLTMYELRDITWQRNDGPCNLILTGKNMPVEHYQYDSEIGKLSKKMKLSQTHQQVLNLLTKGFQSKEIADAMVISKNTADTHRRDLRSRFNCTDSSAFLEYMRLAEVL